MIQYEADCQSSHQIGGYEHTCNTDDDNNLEETSDTSSNMLGGQFRDVSRADHGHGSDSETDGETTTHDWHQQVRSG